MHLLRPIVLLQDAFGAGLSAALSPTQDRTLDLAACTTRCLHDCVIIEPFIAIDILYGLNNRVLYCILHDALIIRPSLPGVGYACLFVCVLFDEL